MNDRSKFFLLLTLLIASIALVYLVTSSYGQAASNAII